jgi:ribosomal protein S17E
MNSKFQKNAQNLEYLNKFWAKRVMLEVSQYLTSNYTIEQE